MCTRAPLPLTLGERPWRQERWGSAHQVGRYVWVGKTTRGHGVADVYRRQVRAVVVEMWRCYASSILPFSVAERTVLTYPLSRLCFVRFLWAGSCSFFLGRSAPLLSCNVKNSLTKVVPKTL